MIPRVSHGYSCYGDHFFPRGFQISEPDLNHSLKKNKGWEHGQELLILFQVLKGPKLRCLKIDGDSGDNGDLQRLHQSCSVWGIRSIPGGLGRNGSLLKLGTDLWKHRWNHRDLQSESMLRIPTDLKINSEFHSTVASSLGAPLSSPTQFFILWPCPSAYQPSKCYVLCSLGALNIWLSLSLTLVLLYFFFFPHSLAHSRILPM